MLPAINQKSNGRERRGNGWQPVTLFIWAKRNFPKPCRKARAFYLCLRQVSLWLGFVFLGLLCVYGKPNPILNDGAKGQWIIFRKGHRRELWQASTEPGGSVSVSPTSVLRVFAVVNRLKETQRKCHKARKVI